MGKEALTGATTPRGAVFLSYASQDQAAAQQICAALRAAGAEVWLDKSELRGGDAWDAAIRKQIKSCALFIPVISRNSHARLTRRLCGWSVRHSSVTRESSGCAKTRYCATSPGIPGMPHCCGG